MRKKDWNEIWRLYEEELRKTPPFDIETLLCFRLHMNQISVFDWWASKFWDRVHRDQEEDLEPEDLHKNWSKLLH